MNRKRNVGLIAVATPLMLGMALASPAEAGRTWAKVQAEVCVPSPAVPAVPATPGTPAVEEVSHMETIIDVEAVEEVSHIETTFQRYSWTGGQSEEHPFPSEGNWQPNEKKDPKDDPIGEAFQKGKGENASWFYWEQIDTKVIDVEAVAEVSHEVKVIDVEAKPAIPGTDEIPAVPAVECPVTPDPEPAPEAKTCGDYAPEGNFVRGEDEEYTDALDGDNDDVACEIRKASSVTNPPPAVEKPSTEALPKTGAATWVLAMAGAGLVGAGASTIYLTRRRP